MFAHSVRFKEFDDIRALQVFDCLAKWLVNDHIHLMQCNPPQVLRGKLDVSVGRISISVHMPPIPGIEDVYGVTGEAGAIVASSTFSRTLGRDNPSVAGNTGVTARQNLGVHS